MRALSPKSIHTYEKALALAFRGGVISLEGLDKARIADWSNSSLNQLKCAVRWYRKSQGLPPKDVSLEDCLQPKYVIQRQVYTPAESEIEALENGTLALTPPERACVLLLLYLGLRAEEFYTLPRKNVLHAVKTNILTFVRKGGREHSLDISKVMPLWQALLDAPAKNAMGKKKVWETVGQVFSEGKPSSQYHVVRRVVGKAFKLAGLPVASPHKLRHAFATRLNRDGASAFIIQAALNHKNISTTALYTHPSTQDVAKFLRGGK